MSLSHHLPNSKAVVSVLAEIDEENIEVPKYRFPQHAITARAALMLVRNELRCDGQPNMNLAGFVTTEVESEATEVMIENMGKNLADTGEYPSLVDLQDRCVNMLADLFHAPSDQSALSSLGDDEKSSAHAVGTSTIGSSEAVMLGGLALKWKWRERMAQKQGQGKKAHDINTRPNLVFSSAVHVSVLKMCRYFDIEARIVPLEHGQLALRVSEAIRLCDENTCGVLAVYGTTLTGEFEDIQGLHNELTKLKETKGWDIPIHVDAASGGMISPFVFPDDVWDFRLERVKSINVSGHKFAQSLPGLGWIVWRTRADLPEDLIFNINYLGCDEPTFTLNFSRSGGNIALQYYQFLRLGLDGFQRVITQQMENASRIANALKNMAKDLFIIHSQNDDRCLPLVAFSINPSSGVKFSIWTLVHWLREKEWVIPAYDLAANVNDITVARIVVKHTLTRGMVDMLIDDIRVTLIALAHHYGHKELVDELEAARDPDHVSRRSHQHRESARHTLSYHDQYAERLLRVSITEHDRSHKPPHSSLCDAQKVQQMNANRAGIKGVPTTHILC